MLGVCSEESPCWDLVFNFRKSVVLQCADWLAIWTVLCFAEPMWCTAGLCW